MQKSFKGGGRVLQYLKTNPPRIIKAYDKRIFSFDIETSNGYLTSAGKVIPFDYSKKPEFYNGLEKVGICYLWQLRIDGVNFYGRELSELIPVFDYLSNQEYHTIFWIHNASFEFTWLLNCFHPTKVFARKPHQLIYFEYDSCMFRCTYMLSRQKLESIGENVGFPKLVDQMDYDAIRHPASYLDPQILEYGIRDVEIVEKYVDKMRHEYELLQRIPLTQTGRPRKIVRKIYQKDWSYHLKMTDLLPRDALEYRRWKSAFVGGWVHANYYYVGVNLIRAVFGHDITSSYPLQMILRKYPSTPWTECDDPDDFEYYLKSKTFVELLEVEFKGHVHSSGFNDYWSDSKIISGENVKAENGRIYAADSFTVFVTSVDFDILKRAYICDHVNIKRLWYSRAAYLDKRFVEFVLDLYNDKVQLTDTGDPVKEELRARSKELLNALYGMMVSAIIHDDTIFENYKWKERPPMTTQQIDKLTNEKLDELRSKPYKNILSYSAGIFVTSYARLSLFEAVEKINKDVTYHDTDSVYSIGRHQDIFDEINERIKSDLLKMALRRGIDPDRLHPKTPSGVEQWIGVWTCDNDKLDGKPFEEFKTLGAKRYAYRPWSREYARGKAAKVTDKKKKESLLKKGNIKITVSGVSKKYGAAALKDDMNEFNDETVFDYDHTKKLIPNYRDDMSQVKWVDDQGVEYVSKYRFGVCMQPVRYVMNLTKFFDVLAALGSLSDQYSEMEIEDLYPE